MPHPPSPSDGGADAKPPKLWLNADEMKLPDFKLDTKKDYIISSTFDLDVDGLQTKYEVGLNKYVGLNNNKEFFIEVILSEEDISSKNKSSNISMTGLVKLCMLLLQYFSLHLNQNTIHFNIKRGDTEFKVTASKHPTYPFSFVMPTITMKQQI